MQSTHSSRVTSDSSARPVTRKRMLSSTMDGVDNSTPHADLRKALRKLDSPPAAEHPATRPAPLHVLPARDEAAIARAEADGIAHQCPRLVPLIPRRLSMPSSDAR